MRLDNYRKSFESFCVEKCSVEENTVYEKMNKKVKHDSVKRVLVTAACIAAAFSMVIGVSAAAGLIDLSEIMRTVFGDGKSAELIEQGDIQEINLTQENDEYKLTFKAITGDLETPIGIFELIDKSGTDKEYKGLEMTAYTLGASVYEDEKKLQGYATFEGFGDITSYDENTAAYCFRLRLAPYWFSVGEDMYVAVKTLKFYDELPQGENSVYSAVPLDFEYKFKPDTSVLKAAHYVYPSENDILERDGFKLHINTVIFSEYKTEVNVYFDMNQDTQAILADLGGETSGADFDANYIWRKFSRSTIDKRAFLQSFNYESESIVENEPMKLYADGVEIPVYTDNKLMYIDGDKYTVWLDTQGEAGENNTAYASLVFEPIDFESAQSVQLVFGEQRVVLK